MDDGPSRPEHATPHTRTHTRGAPTWLGDDPVVQLREWATEKVHLLPGSNGAELVVGSDATVDLRLVDPTGFVSRRHARLRRDGGTWRIQDLRSKNGIRIDGARAPGRRLRIVPGVEIGIGGLTLVAENQTLIGLRGYLGRVLGWGAESLQAIDLAMRAIRAAANRRAPLVLAGADDLVAVARQVHLRTTPPGSPFVVCGKRSHESDGSVRVTATLADASAAFQRAAGGTVCVRAYEPPAGYDELRDATARPQAAAQLFICATKASKRADVVTPPTLVPKLARRSLDEVHRVVGEYAADAVRDLGAAPTSFTEHDHDWVARHAATSFADIEIATLRLVAFHHAGNVHQAAARLGLSHVALGKWFKLRGLVR